MIRRRAALLVAGLALAGALAAPRVARATTWLDRYDLRATIDPSGEGATYDLRFAYQWVDEVKTSGFKYVGRAAVDQLSATDDAGNPVRVTGERDVASDEVKLEFQMPADGSRVVRLRFHQALEDARYDWSGRYAAVSWAHVFRIPVHVMRVEVVGPGDGGGFDCTPGSDGSFHCARETRGAAPVRIPVGPAGDGALVVALGVLLAALAALLAHLVRRRYDALILAKGVIPPASTAAYFDWAQGYRAPPPLPAAPSHPVLPAEDRKAFRVRVTTGVVTAALAIAFVAWAGAGISPVPMPVLVAAWSLVVVALVAYFMSADEKRFWVPVALGASALAFGVGQAFPCMLAGVAAPVLALLGRINWSSGGGGDGSWSSSSSYSSCSSSSSSYSSCSSSSSSSSCSSGSSCGSSSSSSGGGCGG